MGGIEEQIKVTGGAEAKQQLDQVAGATGRVGNEAEQGGRKTSMLGRAFDAVKGSLGGVLTGMLSLTAAIGAASRAWRVFIENMREAAAASEEATAKLTAFSALQAPGTERERARRVAYTAADRGVPFQEAWGQVQQLQSAAAAQAQAAGKPLSEKETFEEGLSRAQGVWALQKLGVSPAGAAEAEVQGAAQGAAAGSFARMSYSAGQLSPRSPAEVARTARGMQYYEDKAFGFGAASVLVGPYGDEAETFVRAGGIALGMTGGLADWYKGKGLAGATQAERLSALAAAGVDTPEELMKAGLTEMRQQQAMITLVRNEQAVQQATAQIRAEDRPGILQERRRALEAADPMLAHETEASRLRELSRVERIMGVHADSARARDIADRERGLKLRRIGEEQALWKDVIDSEGRATEGGEAMVGLERAIKGYSRGGAIGAAWEVYQLYRGLNQEVHYHGPVYNTADPVGDSTPRMEPIVH